MGGKPTFPYIDLSNPDDIPDLASLVSSESWLIFNLLELNGSQDWMTIPANLWDNFVDFKKFKEFAENLSVCNDIAERGVALISSYINRAESKEKREALIQVAELYRSLVTNTDKSSLKKC